ncbi:glycosyltransferase [Paenibacillus cremeus]|uniref:Glycosyltransferase n=1 Tax=Paenibacillus cremeus TaxID=2163881 RepID=A0A559KI63_9BACL|nr:glycosyltransferase [Paenibacillus cremeus]TVY11833.1 glycosyltransferase [Paenibacillus cremeus]
MLKRSKKRGVTPPKRWAASGKGIQAKRKGLGMGSRKGPFVRKRLLKGPLVRRGRYRRLVLPYAETPLVSIVIPAHNQWRYTYACLKSIQRWTHDIPYEIVIADDVSTDQTRFTPRWTHNIVHVRNRTKHGFVLNCNRAAGRARGKYIFFLNNDTRVTDGWLTNLTHLMEGDPQIGMAGSKFVYPSGKLQEAGGIVFVDGSAWNYGRLDDPEQAPYSYLKEVDYVSGAGILIRADLWREIGGFDRRYRPAYYEDVDLAFEVRRRGFKVVYQPLSKIVHFEGVSQGKTVVSGIKRYQLRNRRKFYRKWADILQRDHFERGNSLFLARDRGKHKKTLLVIDNSMPTFDKDTGSRSLYQYLKLFLAMGLNVKFISASCYHIEPYTTVIQQMGIEVVSVRSNKERLHRWVKENGAHLHYVYLLRPGVGTEYIDVIRQSAPSAKVIYNGVDFHFLRESRRYEFDRNPATLQYAMQLKQEEFALFAKSDVVYTVSEYEREILSHEMPEKRTVVIPTYIYDQQFPIGIERSFEERNTITFVGGFSHLPNVDGALWFATEIFPKIREKLPDTVLNLIGNNPPPEIAGLQSANIHVKGFVPDDVLEHYYASSRVVVVPLRYGAGVKGKIIEAVAHGIPVVTTQVGAEGIVDADGIMRIANTAEEFATKVVELYHYEAIWHSIRERQIGYAQNYLTSHHARLIIEQDIRP